MWGTHLNRPVLGSGPEGIGPALDELQHLVADILVGRLIDEARVHLAVGLAGDLVVNGGAAVLHDTLQHGESVDGRVGVRGEHFLLDESDGVFGAERERV